MNLDPNTNIIMSNKNVHNHKSPEIDLEEENPPKKYPDLVKTSVLEVLITNASRDDILEFIFTKINHSNECWFVVTPNPEMIMLSRKDTAFREILNSANISLCDGVGVLLAGRLMGVHLSSRFTGIDAMKSICAESAKRAVTVAFLGGRNGVAEKTAECLRRENPNLRIIFAIEEWSEKYNTIPVDILFVAFGFPKQERWMAEHLGKIRVKMMMGVGGSFDYLSGTVPRAPKLLRAFGLEWLFRLLRQPWRWRRQLALFGFIWLVLKEVFIGRSRILRKN